MIQKTSILQNDFEAFQHASNNVLTKREWFAGMALFAASNIYSLHDDKSIADLAIGIADSTIEKLNKK